MVTAVILVSTCHWLRVPAHARSDLFYCHSYEMFLWKIISPFPFALFFFLFFFLCTRFFSFFFVCFCIMSVKRIRGHVTFAYETSTRQLGFERGLRAHRIEGSRREAKSGARLLLIMQITPWVTDWLIRIYIYIAWNGNQMAAKYSMPTIHVKWNV